MQLHRGGVVAPTATPATFVGPTATLGPTHTDTPPPDGPTVTLRAAPTQFIPPTSQVVQPGNPTSYPQVSPPTQTPVLPPASPSATPPPPPITPSPTGQPCDLAWYFDTPTTAITCPGGPSLTSPAAAQYFQKGAMVYIEQASFYVILPYAEDTHQPGGLVSWVFDPLTIYRDTSAGVRPPEGYFAPVSGFGIVWRGDNLPEMNSDGSPVDHDFYRDLLGWALAPEFEYETTYQCGAGPTVYGVCYMIYPDGRLVRMTMARGAITLWAWEFEE